MGHGTDDTSARGRKLGDDGTDISRRRLLAAGGATALGAALAAAPWASAAADRALAAPDPGGSALDLIGELEHDDKRLAAFGFLTAVDGLDDGALFSGPGRSEATATLTWFLDASVGPRAVAGGVITVVATGELAVYRAGSGGSSFGHPESFANGSAISKWSARLHGVLTPGAGTSTFTGELAQTRAGALDLGVRRVRFGRDGAIERLWLAGSGAATTADLTHWTHNIGGNLVVAALPA